MTSIEELREENRLLSERLELVQKLKQAKALGVQSKVNESFDGSQSSENFTAHFTRVMQNQGKKFKGRSYQDLLHAIASGEFKA